MAVAVKFWILPLICWTWVLPLLSIAHTQTGLGWKSTAQTSQRDTSSEELQFIENLRHVLKEEHTVQDSREENQGIENIPGNSGHEMQNREESLKNFDTRTTDGKSYFSDAIQEAQAEEQEIDDQRLPWKRGENEVTSKAHVMRTPVVTPFSKYRRKYKKLRRKYNRFLRGGNSRYKRKYFLFFKTFRRKYIRLLHKLQYPKMSRRKFKVSLKYYTLLNKFYILRRLVGKSKRKIKTLLKLLAKPNGKEAAKKLARKYVCKYKKLKKLYRLLSKKYAKLLHKVRFLRKHPLRVLPRTCKTLLSFFHCMKKILNRHHKGGKFDVKHILKLLRKNLHHPRTTLCLKLILKTIPPAMPKGTMTPPTKSTVVPSKTLSTTPMPKSTMTSPTISTVVPSRTPSTTLMPKSTTMPTQTTVLPSKNSSTIMPIRTTVLPSKNPGTSVTPPKKTPTPDPKVLGILRVTVPPSTRTIQSPTRATPSPTRTTPPPARTTPSPARATPSPARTTPSPARTTPSQTRTTPSPTRTTPSPTRTTPPPTRTTSFPTRTTAIQTRSSAPRTGATPTPTQFTESALQQIWDEILNS